MQQRELNYLFLKRIGINTHQEPVVYMRQDCHVCRSEGFNAHSRVRVTTNKRSIIATVNQVTDGWLSHQEAGLSDAAWCLLDAEDGEVAYFSHTKAVDSMSHVRGKLYGASLTQESADEVVRDIAGGLYSDVQLAAFVTACAGSRLNQDEVAALTSAMVKVGQRIDWGTSPIMDKHCVGGLPGNRTTPIVVAIVTACGLRMPKTSSRAITSPAGTADTMETMAPVNLSLAQMKKVVEQEGGCIAWGGSVSLSPADDVLIRIERALDLDSEGQLVASVISKKVAAGSTHVLIDIPIGMTAKVRSPEYAERLASHMRYTGEKLGIQVEAMFTDGAQPVGRGIGPALEARDILAVLRNQAEAPSDLRERALTLAGRLLEIGGVASHGAGVARARETLESGAALNKFMAICEAQGGFHEPALAPHCYEATADRVGVVSFVNNRFVSKLAKLAGAPSNPSAGVDFHVKLGQKVRVGDPLFSIYAEAPGELAYALDFLRDHPNEIRIEEESL
ncbi:thymidine phosphorylase family protein [Hahella sp. CR1]|uniref:thymidine phosphorylase family protein n=1 Tax=Hahella sp. CR1 TaxID=2992807 RepID=UPI0024422EEA|nr:thymidine phosphorylase family protein [Hahella sp. CR1]MDG9669794.1 thymidine phosphorylase family protein [Hahella sp. CR1]